MCLTSAFKFPCSNKTFWTIMVSSVPCHSRTVTLGTSNWKRFCGEESSVSSLILPLGRLTWSQLPSPHPRTLGPLFLLSIHLPGLLLCQCTGPGPFQQFMLLSTYCWVPVLDRGLEMLSPLPPYTVTYKISHKLDWDWQFGIPSWRLWWSGIGLGVKGVEVELQESTLY